MTSVTVVVDNRPGKQPGLEGFTPEWGLALWVEHQGQAILLDTGPSVSLLANLAALKLDPSRLEAVVISHGHFDHIGGLGAPPGRPGAARPWTCGATWAPSTLTSRSRPTEG